MTATAAPVIRVHTTSTAIYVRWQGVPLATSYKVYSAATPSPSVVVANPAADAGGWNQAVLTGSAPTYVAVSAVNGAAEESDKSNEVKVAALGTATRHTGGSLFGE